MNNFASFTKLKFRVLLEYSQFKKLSVTRHKGYKNKNFYRFLLILNSILTKNS